MMNELLATLKERGFVEALTAEEEMREVLKKPQKVYIGFDPTADSLHLGNLMGIVALGWFQRFGHTPVALVGGATGKIGDPSGRSQERPLLSGMELDANVSAIGAQLKKLLHANTKIINNDEWFSAFSFTDFLRDVGKHFRLGPMLSKESVKSRLHSEEGMSFTEFSYQLLQGYDFYHLWKHYGIAFQLGGSDQWGNITAGIEYTRKVASTSVFGMTFPLLTRSDGKKFGKSEGGAIWLSAEKCSPYTFYQYLFRVGDADVIKLMRLLTFMDLDEIATYEKNLASAPNTAQKRLAEEVTRFVHGEEGVRSAHLATETAKPGGEMALDEASISAALADLPSKQVSRGEVEGKSFADLALLAGLVTSKGEAGRLVQNGGAYLNNVRVDDPKQVVEVSQLIGGKYLLLASGKKRKIILSVQ